MIEKKSLMNFKLFILTSQRRRSHCSIELILICLNYSMFLIRRSIESESMEIQARSDKLSFLRESRNEKREKQEELRELSIKLHDLSRSDFEKKRR